MKNEIWERKMKILTKRSVEKHVGFSPEKRPHPFRGEKHPDFFKLFKNNFIFGFFFFILKLFFEKFEKFRMFFPQSKGVLSSSSSSSSQGSQLSGLSAPAPAESFPLCFSPVTFTGEKTFFPRIHTNLAFQTFSNFS